MTLKTNCMSNLTATEKRALLTKILNKKVQQPRSYPMSFAQQRLWFMDQLSPGNLFYNFEWAIPLQGPIDLAVLKHAVNEVVKRHDILRTVFKVIDGEPRQIVIPELTIDIPLLDLSTVPAAKREQEKLRLSREMAQQPFDLEQGPLLRISLLQLDWRNYVYLQKM
ncbi:MAG: hypothetical protein GY954_20540, partial [Alteromonas sp.]|nr:hypothetical protein [Alteromonas sp.]